MKDGWNSEEPLVSTLEPAVEAVRGLAGRLEGGAILDRLLGERIGPHLHRVFGAPPAPAARRSRPALAPADRSRFLACVREGTVEAALAQVGRLAAQGVPREDVLLDLLPAAARRLGGLWDDDRIGFGEVTIATCRLHEILRRLSADEAAPGPAVDAPRILLAPVPGDQHSFGILLVAELFRREGWAVSCEPGATRGELLALVAGADYEALGLSALRRRSVSELAGLLRALRAAARDPRIAVLVGGKLFDDDPDLATGIGADATASDARAAVAAAAFLRARRGAGRRAAPGHGRPTSHQDP